MLERKGLVEAKVKFEDGSETGCTISPRSIHACGARLHPERDCAPSMTGKKTLTIGHHDPPMTQAQRLRPLDGQTPSAL
jgi:hypothetical protein